MNSVLRTLVLVPSVLAVLTVAGCGGAPNDIQATTPTSVDGAKVVKTDIACSNGIIHVIDAVVLP